MSIMNSGKKGNDKQSGNSKNKPGGNGSKFMKPNSKGNIVKPVRSTGANRGS
ncbi:hypothetical protein [Flaviaesturariibacter aridisoli]|uniref:hypothetical protein n=1 Tax=Flaviaesturariibacter aridisoli TaxID=2545761 RepID=UPI0014045AF0|nr:hypothetical protein [Flaviaesturariibacter aridisoli]